MGAVSSNSSEMGDPLTSGHIHNERQLFVTRLASAAGSLAVLDADGAMGGSTHHFTTAGRSLGSISACTFALDDTVEQQPRNSWKLRAAREQRNPRGPRAIGRRLGSKQSAVGANGCVLEQESVGSSETSGSRLISSWSTHGSRRGVPRRGMGRPCQRHPLCRPSFRPRGQVAIWVQRGPDWLQPVRQQPNGCDALASPIDHFVSSQLRPLEGRPGRASTEPVAVSSLLSLAGATATTEGRGRQHGVEFFGATKHLVLACVRAGLARWSCTNLHLCAAGAGQRARAGGHSTSRYGQSIPRPAAAHPTLGDSGNAGMGGALHPRMAGPDKRF